MFCLLWSNGQYVPSSRMFPKIWLGHWWGVLWRPPWFHINPCKWSSIKASCLMELGTKDRIWTPAVILTPRWYFFSTKFGIIWNCLLMSQIHLLRGSQVKWSKDSVIWGYWISADKTSVFMLTQVSEIRVNCAALYHMLAVSIVLTIFARQGALVGFYTRAWEAS